MYALDVPVPSWNTPTTGGAEMSTFSSRPVPSAECASTHWSDSIGTLSDSKVLAHRGGILKNSKVRTFYEKDKRKEQKHIAFITTLNIIAYIALVVIVNEKAKKIIAFPS